MFHGIINHNQIACILERTSLLISASKFETFGINIIEAHCYGIPTIVNAAGGVLDIVNKKNGVTILDMTPKSLKQAIIYKLENPRRFDKIEIIKANIGRFGARQYASK